MNKKPICAKSRHAYKSIGANVKRAQEDNRAKSYHARRGSPEQIKLKVLFFSLYQPRASAHCTSPYKIRLSAVYRVH